MLEINPTKNSEEVKTALKKQVAQIADMPQPNEKIEELATAWNHLSTQEAVEEYYAELTEFSPSRDKKENDLNNNNNNNNYNNNNTGNSDDDSVTEIPGSPPVATKNTETTNSVKTSNLISGSFVASDSTLQSKNKAEDQINLVEEQKNTITIYVPIYIQKTELNECNKIESNTVSLYEIGIPDDSSLRQEFIPGSTLIFKDLAERVTKFLQQSKFVQVGLTEEECNKIVYQHSWYKYSSGYGCLQVRIKLDYLTARKSEEEHYGPNSLSARSGSYLSLKPGFVLNENAIESFLLLQCKVFKEKVFRITNPHFKINMAESRKRGYLYEVKGHPPLKDVLLQKKNALKDLSEDIRYASLDESFEIFEKIVANKEGILRYHRENLLHDFGDTDSYKAAIKLIAEKSFAPRSLIAFEKLRKISDELKRCKMRIPEHLQIKKLKEDCGVFLKNRIYSSKSIAELKNIYDEIKKFPEGLLKLHQRNLFFKYGNTDSYMNAIVGIGWQIQYKVYPSPSRGLTQDKGFFPKTEAERAFLQQLSNEIKSFNITNIGVLITDLEKLLKPETEEQNQNNTTVVLQ